MTSSLLALEGKLVEAKLTDHRVVFEAEATLPHICGNCGYERYQHRGTAQSCPDICAVCGELQQLCHCEDWSS